MTAKTRRRDAIDKTNKKKKPRETLAPTGLSGPLVSILTTPRMQGTSPLPNHNLMPWRPRPGMRREGFGSLQVSMVGHRPSRHRDFFELVSVVFDLFIDIFFCRTTLLARWAFDDPTITRSAMERANTAPKFLVGGKWGRQTDPDPSPSGPRGCVWMAHARQRYMLGGLRFWTCSK